MAQPDSSLQALASVSEKQLDKLRTRITKSILEVGPGTVGQLAERLKVSEYAVSKRVSELLQGNVLLRQGRERNPKSGRFAAVLWPGAHAEDFAAGYYTLPDKGLDRRDRLARVLKAANAVIGTRDTRDGLVLVPMSTMMELHIALNRYAEAKQP